MYVYRYNNMYVYRHNNVCMSIDMVIENSELKSALWQLLLLTPRNGLRGWLVCCLGVEGGLCVAFCSGS